MAVRTFIPPAAPPPPQPDLWSFMRSGNALFPFRFCAIYIMTALTMVLFSKPSIDVVSLVSGGPGADVLKCAAAFVPRGQGDGQFEFKRS